MEMHIRPEKNRHTLPEKQVVLDMDSYTVIKLNFLLYLSYNFMNVYIELRQYTSKKIQGILVHSCSGPATGQKITSLLSHYV
jgi:hypothetical protein